MINKVVKSIFLPLMLMLLSITGCDKATEPETVEDPTEFGDYELIWSDEFDGEELDNLNWGYDLGYGDGGWGNDEWQLYTDSPENVRVEDGNMVITAVWDSINFSEPGKRDGSITSARVNTKDKFSFKFGKVKARIKPPSGMGMWPAFWMLGNIFDSIGWPQCGEIDIMEMSSLYHNDNTTMFTLHWWDEAGEFHDSDGATREFTYSLTEDYHIFELEWNEQRVVGKIDDITYFVRAIDPASMDEFLRKFFLIFNVAVGGNLGGSPDGTTQWNQSMYVDWVRVYQQVIETYGLFTDGTPVDDGLQVGVNAEIYVWDNTLSVGSIEPYEGSNVISWTTNGVGWFGGGISSSYPVDLSKFAYGNLKFMIKMPANVTFKIGINDTDGNENYVVFPANETAFGLVRNGEWERATIPIDEIKGSVDLEILDYEFIILEQEGTQCEFALDDIYWDGGGTVPSSVSFDQDIYAIAAAGAVITVDDLAAAGNTVTVTVDNGTETISIEFVLDAMGMGTGTVNFGPTDDATDTIAITAGGSILANYLDFNGNVKTATAEIESGGEPTGNYGIFTDETPVDAGLEIDVNANIYVWENTLNAGTIPPYEGDNVISWSTAGTGWFGGGISSTSPLDLSAFAYGNIKFMIKMPADVTFKIGINDTNGNENYVTFPANQTAFGLVRDGNWGQASIPVNEIKGSVNLAILEYEFIILEENGTQCEFAIDDIYWNGEGATASSVSFDAGSYANDATGAVITVDDGSAAENTVNVTIDNGTDTISLDIVLDGMGMGTGTLNFGPTNDATDTIAITAGGTLTATYIDGNGIMKTDTANIESGSTGDVIGIYTESHDDQMLVYGQIWNSADWSGNGAIPDEESTDVSPVDGVYVLSVEFEAGGAGWGGIAFDFGTPGQDISGYNTLIININKTAMPTLDKLGIKFEDTLTGQTEINITYYTPIVTGDWMRYEIPLSDFSVPDHTDIKYLGLWNPQDSSNTLLTGFLYFDDIYLINR